MPTISGRGGHDLAGGGVAELDDRFDHLPFLLVDDAFLLALLDGGEDLLLDLLGGSGCQLAMPRECTLTEAVAAARIGSIIGNSGRRAAGAAGERRAPTMVSRANVRQAHAGMATEKKSVIVTASAAARHRSGDGWSMKCRSTRRTEARTISRVAKRRRRR